MKAGARAGLVTALVTGWGLFLGLGLAVAAQGGGGFFARILLPLLAMLAGLGLGVADHFGRLKGSARPGMVALLVVLPVYVVLVWGKLFT